MSTSLDLSGKTEPYLVDLCQAIDRAAAATGVPFLMVGATARDLILHHGYGIQTGRRTQDVDFGIQVQSWPDFERLRGTMTDGGEFAQGKPSHRLIFRGFLRVDIVPFGAISSSSGEISWPEDRDVHMNVLGFDEALRTAIKVKLAAEPPIEINVASPLGLIIMKFMAWADRRPERGKDAADLLLAIRHYVDVGNNRRLHEDHADLFEAPNFTLEIAGAQLLARDLADFASPPTLRVVLETLEKETDGAMGFDLASTARPDDIAPTITLLTSLKEELKRLTSGY